MGGPTHSSRGLTLKLETTYIESVVESMFDIDLLIQSQESLLDRARRIYNDDAISIEVNTLNMLLEISALPDGIRQHRMLDFYIECSDENQSSP